MLSIKHADTRVSVRTASSTASSSTNRSPSRNSPNTSPIRVRVDGDVYAVGVLTGPEVEERLIQAAIKKANAPFDKSVFLGFLAGVWVGLGGIAALTVAGGIPIAVRNAWPMLPKLCMGVFFTFALHFIVMFGGDLFTGSMMTLTIGVLNRAVPMRRLVLNWLAVYLGNWAGCLFAAYFFALRTELFDAEPFHSYLQSFALGKITGHSWGTLFLKAIPANTLVGMAVVLGTSCRDGAGKIMALYFPVLLFVISGYEHCVANMFFVAAGLMYGAPSTIARFWYNQSAAIVGNFVGGALLIAGSLHALNHWVSIFTLLPACVRLRLEAWAPDQDQEQRPTRLTPDSCDLEGNDNGRTVGDHVVIEPKDVGETCDDAAGLDDPEWPCCCCRRVCPARLHRYPDVQSEIRHRTVTQGDEQRASLEAATRLGVNDPSVGSGVHSCGLSSPVYT